MAGLVQIFDDGERLGQRVVVHLQRRYEALLVAREVGVALVLAAGAYESGIDGSLAWAETMAFITAAILMGLGLVRSNFGYLSVGVGLAFLSLVTLMFEYFESNLGAPVALIISGALLVASVLALIPLRRVLAARHHG